MAVASEKTTEARPRNGAPVELQDLTANNLQSPLHTSSEALQSGDDDAIEYPAPAALTLITIALALAIFLTALDNMIIATAIPFITTQFNSLDDVGWYGAAYLITAGSFQLIFGKFYIFFPIKWVFLISIVIFEVGSLVCALAPSSKILIIGRAIAGIGSAGVYSGSMVILSYAIPLRMRPIYFGGFGGVYAIASVVGPLLGGVFTDKVTWRWCFYINLPIGGITLAVILLIMKHPKQADMSHLTWKKRVRQLDFPGNALFMTSVICFVLAIQWGGNKYPWANGRIIALFVLAGVFAAIFISIQIWLGDNATVPPRIIKMRSIWITSLFTFFLTGAMFFTIFYLPIWFQAVQGVSAVQSGIRNLPMILSLTVASFVCGALITKVGYYTPFMIGGAALVVVGEGLLSTLKPNSSKGVWIGYQVLIGVGVGSSNQQSLLAVQTVLGQKDIPIGTAIAIFSQTLGGAVAVAIGQAIFTQELAKNLIKHVPGIDPKIIIQLGASNIQKGVEEKYIDGVRLAYNNAVATAFYVGVAFTMVSTILACGMEWRSVNDPVDNKSKDIEAKPTNKKQPREDDSRHLPEIRRFSEVMEKDAVQNQK